MCGSNAVTYLSACFAGCTKAVSPDRRQRGAEHTHASAPTFTLLLFQNLSGCTCVSSSSEEAVALPGKCPSPGCQEAFLTFLCVICVCSMIGAMAQTPSVIILIRRVKQLLSTRGRPSRPQLREKRLGKFGEFTSYRIHQSARRNKPDFSCN